MRDVEYLNVYEHPNGRIITRSSGRCIHPAWVANDYIQWDEEHGKYGLYRYDTAPPRDTKGSIILPGGALIGPKVHERVGAEPSFERALDWLLNRPRL